MVHRGWVLLSQRTFTRCTDLVQIAWIIIQLSETKHFPATISSCRSATVTNPHMEQNGHTGSPPTTKTLDPLLRTRRFLQNHSRLPLPSTPHLPPHRICHEQPPRSNYSQTAEWTSPLHPGRVCDGSIEADLREEYEWDEDTWGYDDVEEYKWEEDCEVGWFEDSGVIWDEDCWL